MVAMDGEQTSHRDNSEQWRSRQTTDKLAASWPNGRRWWYTLELLGRQKSRRARVRACVRARDRTASVPGAQEAQPTPLRTRSLLPSQRPGGSVKGQADCWRQKEHWRDCWRNVSIVEQGQEAGFHGAHGLYSFQIKPRPSLPRFYFTSII
jgi:hypothetical protein